MGSTQRHQPWQYGDTAPVVSKAVQTSILIAKGDLVGQAAGSITGATSAASIVAGDVFPASDTPWDTSLAVTQEAFHDAFLGVSNQRSRSGDVEAVVVHTRGVHLFDCASASFKVGDLVGPAKQSGNLLEDKKVVAVATANLAIGRVAAATSSATKVLVDVFGTVSHGGPQVMA